MNQDIIKIENAIKNIINCDVNYFISIPQNLNHGHLTTNICMIMAKEKKTAPIILAKKIMSEINQSELNIEKIDIAGPGFLNFKMNEQFFKNIINSIENENYQNIQINKPQKINLEYVSANPTGKLHIGHARGAVFGSALAQILKRVGHNVHTEYYINDAGSQMQNLAKSVQTRYLQLLGHNLKMPEDSYGGDDIKKVAQKIYEIHGNNKIEADLSFFEEFGYEYNMENIRHDLKNINVEIDNYVAEKIFYDNNQVDNLLKKLADKNLLYEKDGAIWFKSTAYADEKDRVLVKENKETTYLVGDALYHNDKIERKYDHLINIWGADHHGYIDRLKAAVEAISGKKDFLEVLLIQMVQVIQNDQVVKMSKRAGTSVQMDELTKLIGKDALRFFLLMRANTSQLDLDITVAQKNDKDNPVYYIQYANARINSLIDKVDISHIKQNYIIQEIDELDQKLLIKLLQYEKTIIDSSKLRAPHILATYLYELASDFHKYYGAKKIIDNNVKKAEQNVYLTTLVQKIIRDGFKILKISLPNKM